MAADFAIDNFEFVNLTQPPSRPQEQPVVISRAGVVDLAIFLTGARGEPFRLTSSVDVKATLPSTDHIGAAVTLLNSYKSSTGGTPVQIKWNAVTQPGTYVVLNVEEQSIRRAMAPVGGLVQGGAVLTAIWTLVAVS